MESSRRWRNLFLFCIGLTIGTAFIMQWLGTDFWVNDERFSILGLELFYSKKEIIKLLTDIKQPAKIALNYHLTFDFVLMAGFYPGIASACMLVRERILQQKVKTILFTLAVLQPVAWIFDVIENSYLIQWVSTPEIGDEFSIYHNMVIIKWLIAACGILLSLMIYIFTDRQTKRRRRH